MEPRKVVSGRPHVSHQLHNTAQETVPRVLAISLSKSTTRKLTRRVWQAQHTRQKGTPQNDGSGDDNAMPMSHAS